jgi:hypothetical protein
MTDDPLSITYSDIGRPVMLFTVKVQLFAGSPVVAGRAAFAVEVATTPKPAF